jgi:hypothetical protein
VKFILLPVCVCLIVNIYAQTTTKKEKNIRILPIPVASVSPETGLLYGFGASSTFRLHPKNSQEKPSLVNAGISLTTKKQLLSFIQFSIFDRNKYFYFGEVGYYKFSYFYYGIGKNEVPEELYKVNFPRIKINAVKKVSNVLSLGLGVQFENFDIQETVAGGVLSTQTITGSAGSRTSGLGLVAIIDSRDSVFFPGKGAFANINFYNNGKHFGGTANFSRFIADVAFYKKLHPKVVLANQVYNSFIMGKKIPFQQLSQLGGNKLMRGYYQGRYLDKNMSLLQSELRFPLYKRFGLATFGSAAALGNEKDFLRTNDLKFSYGVGLRFTFNRKEHMNARIDYARGKDKGFFYLTVGEAF